MRRTTLWLALALATGLAPVRADPVPEGDCAGVYWDLTAAFASGDRIYARALVTRAGPGDRNAAALGHWIAPDGSATRFQNGRSEGRFELDPEGLLLRIGSTRLDLTHSPQRFEVDNDKRGVKLRVELDVGAQDSPETVLFDGDLEVTLLQLGRPARATLWRRGMGEPREARGWASLVRTRHAACEHELATLRVDVHRLGDATRSLFVHQRLASGATQSWIGWRTAGGAIRVRRPAGVALEDWFPDPHVGRLPGRLVPKGPDSRGSVAIGRPHLSIDPLGALPRLVRMLYWFGQNPRRIWTSATWDLEPGVPGAPDARAPGATIASFSILRPPDDPTLPTDSGG